MNEKLKEINENTSAAINVRVSPSAHPESISQFGDVLVDDLGGSGAAGYSAARSALKAIYLGATDIDAAHAALLEPTAAGAKGQVRMEIPPARRAELASLMAAKAAKVAQHHQRCCDRVDQSIAELDGAVAQAITRRGTSEIIAESQEIRAYVMGLPDTKRVSWIHERVVAGDIAVVHAVLNSSPWISGLTPDQQLLLRGMANEKFAPRESKQAAALRAIAAQLTKAATAFANVYTEKLPKVVEDARQQALARLKN